MLIFHQFYFAVFFLCVVLFLGAEREFKSMNGGEKWNELTIECRMREKEKIRQIRQRMMHKPIKGRFIHAG